MQILQNLSTDQLTKELNEIGVAPEAHQIFLKKAHYRIIKLHNLSAAQANVLKQIALTCGADVAIPATAYFGAGKRKFAVMVFANLREIEKMIGRLSEQPWMETIKLSLSRTLASAETPTLKIATNEIRFSRTHIMGIINLSPDSFYSGSRYATASAIRKVIEQMQQEGADFIDLGAESTRPGAKMLSDKEEIERLKPVLPAIVKNTKIPVSVDTYKTAVAKYALDQGVKIINDISGFGFSDFNQKFVKTIAKYDACVVIMHIQGTPETMQTNPRYKNLMSEILSYLEERIDFALANGIKNNRIVIDPGLGFGKKIEDNYEIIRRLNELRILSRPIMVGHSRKSFIGVPFNLPPEERLEGSLCVAALLIENGASIIRVHDVAEAKKVAQIVDKIVR